MTKINAVSKPDESSRRSLLPYSSRLGICGGDYPVPRLTDGDSYDCERIPKLSFEHAALSNSHGERKQRKRLGFLLIDSSVIK